MTQMVQTAACNKHHSLDQQLCRWLLLSLDRGDASPADRRNELSYLFTATHRLCAEQVRAS
jgi:hypothetical protein